MLFRDWWRIETMYGYVELELDEGGTPLTDEHELDETEQLCFLLTREMKKLNPRVLRPMLELYAQFHPEHFPPGISLANHEIRDIVPVIPAMAQFLETQVEAGTIRLYHDEIVMTKAEKVEKVSYSAEPVVPEKITFIGAEIRDQDNQPVIGTRVQFELPDGDIKVVPTNGQGIAKIENLGVAGNAKISLLDFMVPGKAEAVEQDPVTEAEKKEFSVKVVDETGEKGIAKVPMVFKASNGQSKTVPTDGDGVAKWSVAADSASVFFETASALSDSINPIWETRAATPSAKYLAVSDDVIAVVSRPESIELPNNGGALSPVSLEPTKQKTFSVRPGKKRAVYIELHDTLFRNDSAVVNPEGEAPSKVVGEHEAITTVGIIATLLRYNEEHSGKKLFVAGHTDRAGDGTDNKKLSNLRGQAVWALVEGKKDKFVEACKAKHSEVDVTQLMDWVHKQYGFRCKPTTLTANPSNDNYYLFRTDYNAWCKGALDPDEKGPRGTKINDTGRLEPPDIWDAMFDLYEHNLRQELGEDENGVKDLRKLVNWVSTSKKYYGFGETHPTVPNTADGTRRDADRRVEVLLFDEKEVPNLTAGNGDEIYDTNVYEPEHVAIDFPISSRIYSPFEIWLFDEDRKRMPNTPYRIAMPDGTIRMGQADANGMVSESDVPDFETVDIQWGRRDFVDPLPLPSNDEEATNYYSFGATLLIHSAIINGRPPELLRNLGHVGSESEQRAAFQQYYASSADSLITEVHNTGKPA